MIPSAHTTTITVLSSSGYILYSEKASKAFQSCSTSKNLSMSSFDISGTFIDPFAHIFLYFAALQDSVARFPHDTRWWSFIWSSFSPPSLFCSISSGTWGLLHFITSQYRSSKKKASRVLFFLVFNVWRPLVINLCTKRFLPPYYLKKFPLDRDI